MQDNVDFIENNLYSITMPYFLRIMIQFNVYAHCSYYVFDYHFPCRIFMNTLSPKLLNMYDFVTSVWRIGDKGPEYHFAPPKIS